jgi:poly-beta-1,6-N-acetyl-D-glucosamine synthase
VTAPLYIVITPARNEGSHIAQTIKSVASQTIRPMKWIIVNDGSTDDTITIIDKAAQEHSWIAAVHRRDRGSRKQGGGVVETFYDGYDLIKSESWDFLVKLDGDLSFEPDYFENCFQRFDANPKLGIAGGTICIEKDGKVTVESPGDPRFHVRGATKIYRRACWENIGGLLRETGWDTLDEVKANMIGWKTATFSGLNLIHHRPTGNADGSWKNWFKNGRANYIVGYHPLFMLAKCIKRLFEKPYGVMSLALWSGFASGYAARVRQVKDRNVVRYLRREQMRALLFKPSFWSEKT